ncbi:MAG: IS110 family transposase [Bacteroidaceae bacterium]|nr:IS110 family transposase [Bacteroidaceae bacterium]
MKKEGFYHALHGPLLLYESGPPPNFFLEKSSRPLSVDGVRPVVALNMIVITEAFTRFNNARQFNCFAGLAPFQYMSGSSQPSKARVSHRADKSIKSLLHLSAVSVIGRKTGDMKQYYLRKVEQGKNKTT